MIWLAASVALVIVLALLQLTPMQLSAISLGVSSGRWQLAAYLTLVGWLALWSLPYAHRLLLNGKASKAKGSISNNRYYTKLVAFCYSLLMLGVFWLAVLINGVAQRMAAIEQSVPKVVFVEASVRPVGLSDRRLLFESNPDQQRSQQKSQSQQPKLQQGYRQLVTLHDIQFYTRLKNKDEQHSSMQATQASINQNTTVSKSVKTSMSPKQQWQLNPLAVDTSELKDKLDADVTRQNDTISSYQLPKTMTVMLSAYQSRLTALNTFAPDQQLRMQLQLSPIELLDADSEGEFDEYRWLSSRHATAKAKVLAVDFESQQMRQSHLRQWVDNKRFGLRKHFLQFINSRQLRLDQNQQTALPADAIAVTLSLLTGDRSLISPQMTDLYRFAGISHLLAISGTHVLFLAMLCAGLVTSLITRFASSFYQFVPRWQCAFVISVLAAFGYALFAGFDVPALRTACMLLAVGVLRYLLASASVFKVLLLMAVAMVWADVFVLWQAGFWLSFIAVAVLVIYSQRWETKGDKQPLTKQMEERASIWVRLAQVAVGMFKLQMWMSVALLPISLWLFGQVSLWGFLVNLFAIGLFGWIIVPINLLAGILYAALPNHPEWADRLWFGLFWLLDGLHQLLFVLQERWQQVGWIYARPSLALLLLLFLVALPWILPKGLFSRLLSVPPLLVIAVLGIHHHQQRQHLLYIQVLTPMKQDKNTPLSATLIWHQQQAWLLLSAYPKATSFHKPISLKTETNREPLQALWSPAQEQLHIQSLYEQIRQQHLSHLTGIIVQTATPQLASMVVHLSQLLPTSYYWQAGLVGNQSDVEAQLAGSAMTAQGCHLGQMWQFGNLFKLTAETGWDTVASQSVWDCAINLTTTTEVQLPKSMQLPRLYGKPQATLRKVTNDNVHGTQPQRFLFYSSNQPQLGHLWQLMCANDLQTRADFNISTDINMKGTHKVLTQGVDSDRQRHWLTSSQASIDKALVINRQPMSWHILDAEQIPTTLKLKETHLYWQQYNQYQH